MSLDRRTLWTRVVPAVVAAIATVVVPTWLMTGGAVWRFADRQGLLRYVPFDQGRQPIEQLVRNYGVFAEPSDPDRPLVVMAGSSHAGFAIDPGTIEAVWTAQGRAGRARMLWQPAVDTLTAYLLTQRVRPGAARVALLGLSPHMTMFNPEEPDDQAKFAWLYADPWHPYPAGYERDTPAAEWWCPPYRLRRGLWMVAGGAFNKLVNPYNVYRKTMMVPDSMMGFNDREAFDVVRERFRQTRSPQDYIMSFGGFTNGAFFIGWRREVFTTWVWEPTTPPWAHFRDWRRLVRERGLLPIVVLLPMNPIFQEAAVTSIIAGGDPTLPVLDPERLVQWREDVGRAVVDTPELILWDDMNRYPPEAFYDVEHMLPQPRLVYSRLIAHRLLDAGVLDPRPAGPAP